MPDKFDYEKWKDNPIEGYYWVTNLEGPPDVLYVYELKAFPEKSKIDPTCQDVFYRWLACGDEQTLNFNQAIPVQGPLIAPTIPSEETSE